MLLSGRIRNKDFSFSCQFIQIISVKKDVKEESKVEEKGDGQLSANQQPANTPVTMGEIVHLATDIDILTNEMVGTKVIIELVRIILSS